MLNFFILNIEFLAEMPENTQIDLLLIEYLENVE